MTPAQLQKIQAKINRAEEIVKDLKFLEGKSSISFTTSMQHGGNHVEMFLRNKIIDHGLKAYREALELELSQIEINTKEKSNGNGPETTSAGEGNAASSDGATEAE